MGCGCDVFIGSYTKAERVEEFMHEFFLACNQSMPVKGKFLEEATPTPFVSSCFVYVKPPTHHSRERHRILSPTPYPRPFRLLAARARGLCCVHDACPLADSCACGVGDWVAVSQMRSEAELAPVA